MILAVSVICALFWFCFTLFIFYVKQRPEAQVRRRLYHLIETAVSEREKQADKTKKISRLDTQKDLPQNNFYRRIISPIFNVLDEKFQKFAPAQIKTALEDKIFRAGKMGVWSLPRVVSFWVVTLFAGTTLAVIVTMVVHLHFLQEVVIILMGIIWGAVFPLVRLNTMIIRRQKEIRRALPEFLDLLCVSVQAGLSFDGAVAKITARMKGALTDEFKRFQSDVSLGMTHQHALTQMARRCNLEEMYLFTSSVIQAEKLGTSMGRTLKIQADNMRDRHRQFIKAEALKAPVKIIFPMIIFIFPSIFVVLLMPAVLTFLKNMGG